MLQLWAGEGDEIEMEFIIILWMEIKSEFIKYIQSSIWRNFREFEINYSVVPVLRQGFWRGSNRSHCYRQFHSQIFNYY